MALRPAHRVFQKGDQGSAIEMTSASAPFIVLFS